MGKGLNSVARIPSHHIAAPIKLVHQLSNQPVRGNIGWAKSKLPFAQQFLSGKHLWGKLLVAKLPAAQKSVPSSWAPQQGLFSGQPSDQIQYPSLSLLGQHCKWVRWRGKSWWRPPRCPKTPPRAFSRRRRRASEHLFIGPLSDHCLVLSCQSVTM